MPYFCPNQRQATQPTKSGCWPGESSCGREYIHGNLSTHSGLKIFRAEMQVLLSSPLASLISFAISSRVLPPSLFATPRRGLTTFAAVVVASPWRCCFSWSSGCSAWSACCGCCCSVVVEEEEEDMGVSGLPCPVAGAAGAAALALSLASMVMLAWLSLSDALDSPSASAGCWVLLERWKPQAPSRVRWLFPLAANSGALLAGPPRGRPAPGREPPCAALDAMLRGVGSAHRTSRALIYFGSNRSIQ